MKDRDSVGRGTLLGKCALVFLPSECSPGIQRLEIFVAALLSAVVPY